MSKNNENKLVPRLRFPEFGNERMWEEIKLKQFGNFYRGLTYGAGDTNNEGLLVLRSGNIQNDRLVLDNDLVFVNKDCPKDLRLIEGDIVICMSNGSKPLVGKNAEYNGGYSGEITIGAFCSILRPKNRFTKYLLQTDYYQKFIALSIGGGNINNLKNSDLEEFKCLAPKNLEEQQRIASCLSSLDDLITAEGKKLEVLKEHKKGLLQNLFPQEGETVPKLRFKEFEGSGEWEEKKLGEMAIFTGGGTPSKSKVDFWQGNIPWISSSDIEEDSIHQIKITRFITEEALKESATKLVPANSVLLVSRVGVGKLAVSTQPLCTSQDFTSFSPVDDDSIFLGYYLKSKREILLSFSQGMAIKGFTKDDISKLKLLIPSKSEQQKIALTLSSLDELIIAQGQKIEALQLHKKGLLQGLFPKINEGNDG